MPALTPEQVQRLHFLMSENLTPEYSGYMLAEQMGVVILALDTKLSRTKAEVTALNEKLVAVRKMHKKAKKAQKTKKTAPVLAAVVEEAAKPVTLPEAAPQQAEAAHNASAVPATTWR